MGLLHSPSIVTNGLVLALDAANTKSYPGSGTTWFDISGRNNHGTLTSVSYNATDTGNMVFDASSDYIVVSHNADFNFNNVMTASIWLKISEVNPTSIYNIISKKPSFNNTQVGWSCQYDFRTNGILQYRNNDGTTLNDSTPTANVNNTLLLNQTTKYVNSVWVISGTSVTFYINGVVRGTGTSVYTNTNTTTPIYIGKTLGSVADGVILSSLSNITLHNRALSAAEVQQNFNALRGRFAV